MNRASTRPTRGLRALGLACARPFGYVALVVALAALSVASKLPGREQDVDSLASRLRVMVASARGRRGRACWAKLVHRCAQFAAVVWMALFMISISPLDPIAGRLDGILLLALGAIALWRRASARRRLER